MLVHLSNTSPYVCDLSRGPIEEANRMASAPTKKATALLEQKESFPKVTRTPLKLLAPEEIPMDTTATATDINASLQPVWYTEQTIVDEQSVHIEEQQGRSSLHPRSTLPTIQSESPSIPDDDEELPAQPSLMHKSSTFTIEPSMTLETRLEELEKENSTNQPIAPSDDSFRALEQLLGLGSGGTIRDSPKTNHDTLSLTVVTPTDIINSTSTSIRMSITAKQGADSLPSSQELTTIESINPPSFLMENTTMEVDQTSTTLNQDERSLTINQDKLTDSSGDETNFSFELNDFSNESTNNIQAAPAPVPVPNIRAPTCTDVAFRALLKARKGGRISQPVKADSPLAQPSKGRSSAPTARMLRSSCRRISTEAAAESTTDEQTTTPTECFVNDGKTEFVEMVTLNEEDEVEQDKSASLTLNMSTPPTVETTEVDGGEQNVTPPKPMIPELSREYTFDTPKRRSSARGRSMLNSTYGTPMQQNTNQEEEEEKGNNSMLNILLTKPTEVSANVRKSARSSSAITSKSMLNVLLTQQPTDNETPVTTPIRTPKRKTINSPAIPSQSMLEVLLTQPTEPNANTPKRKTNSIASKSMLNVLLTQPTEAKPQTPKRKTNSVASKSMLNVLLTQPTEAKPQTPKRKTNSIASKSMLNVLLTQPITDDDNQTEEIISTEQLESSPSVVPSKSMLDILLTEETEANTEPSIIQESPAVPSRSMLNVLLTNPIEEVETPILDETLPVQPSNTRQSRRSAAQTTPRGSINPLHSSTPSAPRSKSLQIVSIGEEEQVSTIVPQQQEIQIVNLNQTNDAIQGTIARTLEMGVQTTPSIDISARRRLRTLEPQTTPSTSMIVANEDKPITPLQTRVIVNLQRRVCFQLTPTTDARLAEKEKLEEALRGLKPDIVIEPTPIEVAPQSVEKVKKAPVKPKKKIVASKAKKVKEVAAPAKRTTRKAAAPKVAQPTKRTQSKEKPAKRAQSEEKPTKRTQSKEKPAKRAQSKEKPAKRTQSEEKPTKRTPSKENSTKRSQSKEKPPVPPASKRTSRKRTIEQVKEKPVVETTIKRVRNSKSADLPPPVPKAQPIKQEKPIAQSVERPSRTRSRSTNNQKRNSQLKTTTPIVRTSKRRLESVDKTESTKKKVEEVAKPVSVATKVETNNDERQKLESLTVAQLKTRLNTHKANIPKNAKKADLIALLIPLETSAQQNTKPTETIPVNTTTTAMTTRRRKK